MKNLCSLKVYFFLFKSQLVQEFSRFGSMDVKVLDSKHAIIAVTSHYRYIYLI